VPGFKVYYRNKFVHTGNVGSQSVRTHSIGGYIEGRRVEVCVLCARWDVVSELTA